MSSGKDRRSNRATERVDYKKLHEGSVVRNDGECREENEERGVSGSGINKVEGAYVSDTVFSDLEPMQDVQEDEEDEQEREERLRSLEKEYRDLEREEKRLETEQREATLRKKIEEKRRKVEGLKGKLLQPSRDTQGASNKSSRGVRKNVGDLVELSNLTISDLRKNSDLKKKVKKENAKLGLELLVSDEFSSENDNESSEDTEFSEPKNKRGKENKVEFERKKSRKHKSKNYDLSSDSTQSDSETDSSSGGHRGRRKKTKSGIRAKASDKVKNKQSYPQSHLRFEFVNESVTFETLDLNLFVAGELEIISSSSSNKLEKKARINLLKRLMYLNSSYEFPVIRNLYAAVLREIELGHLKWGESFQYVETAILSSQSTKKTFKKSNKFSKQKGENVTQDSEKIWFCSQFQRNKCSQKSPHTMVVKGVLRLAHHICATCWTKDKLKSGHPECSSSCPHASD